MRAWGTLSVVQAKRPSSFGIEAGGGCQTPSCTPLVIIGDANHRHVDGAGLHGGQLARLVGDLDEGDVGPRVHAGLFEQVEHD